MVSHDRYTVATFAWFALVFGAGVIVVTGTAEPYVSVAQVPGAEATVVGLTVAGILGGVVVGKLLKRRAWTRMGRRAGLTQEGGGRLSATPDLAGTVRGREVRVRTVTRTTGGSGPGNAENRSTFTSVETGLPDPIEDGVVVAPASADPNAAGANVVPGATASDGAEGFEVVGPQSDAFFPAILSGRSRETLGELDRAGTVSVGDATDAVLDAIPDAARSLANGLSGGDFEATFRDELGMDAATVAHTTEGVLLDGAELRRQCRAVVAVADAAEEVDAGAVRV